MTYLLAPIDQYCERLGVGLLAEPFNLVSNASFLIAAYYFFVWTHWHFPSKRPRQVRILNASMVLVGLGSGLFHSIATGWAQLADILPILFFEICILWGFCQQVARINLTARWVHVVVFLLLTGLISVVVPSEPVGGSQMYFSTILYLGGMSLYAKLQGQPLVARYLLFGNLVFCLSLLARSLDMAVCASWPIGTHFIWHCLNGITLFLVAVGIAWSFKEVTHGP